MVMGAGVGVSSGPMMRFPSMDMPGHMAAVGGPSGAWPHAAPMGAMPMPMAISAGAPGHVPMSPPMSLLQPVAFLVHAQPRGHEQGSAGPSPSTHAYPVVQHAVAHKPPLNAPGAVFFPAHQPSPTAYMASYAPQPHAVAPYTPHAHYADAGSAGAGVPAGRMRSWSTPGEKLGGEGGTVGGAPDTGAVDRHMAAALLPQDSRGAPLSSGRPGPEPDLPSLGLSTRRYGGPSRGPSSSGVCVGATGPAAMPSAPIPGHMPAPSHRAGRRLSTPASSPVSDLAPSGATSAAVSAAAAAAAAASRHAAAHAAAAAAALAGPSSSHAASSGAPGMPSSHSGPQAEGSAVIAAATESLRRLGVGYPTLSAAAVSASAARSLTATQPRPLQSQPAPEGPDSPWSAPTRSQALAALSAVSPQQPHSATRGPRLSSSGPDVLGAFSGTRLLSERGPSSVGLVEAQPLRSRASATGIVALPSPLPPPRAPTPAAVLAAPASLPPSGGSADAAADAAAARLPYEALLAHVLQSASAGAAGGGAGVAAAAEEQPELEVEADGGERSSDPGPHALHSALRRLSTEVGFAAASRNSDPGLSGGLQGGVPAGLLPLLQTVLTEGLASGALSLVGGQLQLCGAASGKAPSSAGAAANGGPGGGSPRVSRG
jgi:hypothetical protein